MMGRGLALLVLFLVACSSGTSKPPPVLAEMPDSMVSDAVFTDRADAYYAWYQCAPVPVIRKLMLPGDAGSPL